MKAKKCIRQLILRIVLVLLVSGCMINGPRKLMKAASVNEKSSVEDWDTADVDLHLGDDKQEHNASNVSDKNKKEAAKKDNTGENTPDSSAEKKETDNSAAQKKDVNQEKEVTITLDMGGGKTREVIGKYDEEMSYQVFEQVNELRSGLGKSKFSWDEDVLDEARIRASEIAVVFEHTRPNGSAISSLNNSIFGENIAMGYSSAKDVMEGWINSPGHYQNMISDNYNGLSVGCFQYKQGNYYVPCWVQLFTVRKGS